MVQEREQTCNKGAASGEETCSNLPAVLTAMLRTTVHTTVAAAAGETTITKLFFFADHLFFFEPAHPACQTSPLRNSFFFGVCDRLKAEVVKYMDFYFSSLVWQSRSIWIFITDRKNLCI